MTNFCDLNIKRNYTSLGEDSIASSLVCPLLKVARFYDLSVGYFSSGVLSTIFPGMIEFARNNGRLRLICSAHLSANDVVAVEAGYVDRESLIHKGFSELFEEEVKDFDDLSLQLLYELIVKEILDIKIAYTETSGDYHDKLGLLYDQDGNTIAFFGSANATENGYRNNYERIRVVKSWISGEDQYVLDEQNEFESLWNNKNPYAKVLEFKESAEKKLLEIIEHRSKSLSSKPIIKLRTYQEKAIQAWVDHQYHGFFVMATGTGKTWTAIFAAKRLLETKRAMVVICAPYKHLIKQWASDVATLFPSAKIILISSENGKWESQLSEAIIYNRYEPNYQIIAISTIRSFQSERFIRTMGKAAGEKLLIVDEAHRFTSRSESIKDQYSFLLGLSATPYSGRSTQSGDELMEFFGGRVFNLPIEAALGKYLVNYFYHPIYVDATEAEERRFHSITTQIMGCFRDGILVDRENLPIYIRNRLRVISMAENKITQLGDILERVKETDHVVVYCGDGRLFDDNRQKELRHIQFVKGILDQHGHRAAQFTADENISRRMEIVDAFDKAEITAVAAIRCLDEGINIPSIKSALILSSNDDYREFVQRRGRILRQHKGKETAHIYDVIVLPSTNTQGLAVIELRRYLEYAHLALNSEELLKDLDILLDRYDLTLEAIGISTAETEEEALDE